MTAVAVAPLSVPGAFFQRTAPGEPVRLEALAQVKGPQEFHFYISGVTFAELAPLIGSELASTEALIFKMPPSLLNSNYWEPHTPEAEEAVREKMTAVITRDDGGTTMLWRSDAVAPGRHLRDGLDVPVELLLGYVFKVRGPDLLKLGEAWEARGPDPKDRFEWIAFRALPSGDGSIDAAIRLHDDLTVRVPGSVMAYAGAGNRQVRIVLTHRALFRRCVGAALRGYMMRCTGRVVSAPNEKTCEDFIARAGHGLTSHSDGDFVSKGTTYEFTARPGRTPWSGHPPTESPDGEDELRVLVYYDRVSGIWAVAS